MTNTAPGGAGGTVSTASYRHVTGMVDGREGVRPLDGGWTTAGESDRTTSHDGDVTVDRRGSR